MRLCNLAALLAGSALFLVLLTTLAASAPRRPAISSGDATVTAQSKMEHHTAWKGQPFREATSRCKYRYDNPFEWGMSVRETMDIIEKDIQTEYLFKIDGTPNAATQDRLRKEMKYWIGTMHGSYIRFNGQRTGWDESLIDREYGHRNSEAMLVVHERDRKRRHFLFFWQDQLYKQVFAFDAGSGAGKTFDEFAKSMQADCGEAEVKFQKKQTTDEMVLDCLQWPPVGDYLVRAYDHSGFYGTFSLVLLQRSVYERVERDRLFNSPPRIRNSKIRVMDYIIGEPEPDPNEDIVDEILGGHVTPSSEQKRILERSMKQQKNNPTLKK